MDRWGSRGSSNVEFHWQQHRIVLQHPTEQLLCHRSTSAANDANMLTSRASVTVSFTETSPPALHPWRPVASSPWRRLSWTSARPTSLLTLPHSSSTTQSVAHSGLHTRRASPPATCSSTLAAITVLACKHCSLNSANRLEFTLKDQIERTRSKTANGVSEYGICHVTKIMPPITPYSHIPFSDGTRETQRNTGMLT